MEHGKPAESFGERCDKKRANPFPEFPNRDKQGLVDSIARMEILQDLRRRGDDRLLEKALIRSVAGGRQRGIEEKQRMDVCPARLARIWGLGG